MGEEKSLARRFKEKHHLTFPVFADTEGKLFPGLMHDKAIPYNVVIDREGIVRYSAAGFESERLAGLIKQLLASGS